jgi:two-component system phosphate regulon sensor histidine kinase PhoR
MHEQGTRMQRLVQDLLTLSRLESSDTPLIEESIGAARLLGELRTDAEALSQGRHRISVEIACGDLRGSRDELFSAFGNLVSNAIRYTPQGGEVTISWRRTEDGAVLEVRDSGPGIAPEHLPRLTERFYRVDKSRSRETGGTGLGLAIVKHVLMRHQGRLDIQSQLGRGSVFSAWLPGSRLLEPEGRDR